ncbi:MAG: glycosyltransferase [Vicinamibacteria bacterium]|nr:glycosyltransferase [Vicinamibacteria bacterium]
MERAVRSHRILGRLRRDWRRRAALHALDRTGVAGERSVVPFDLAAARPAAAVHHALFLLEGLDRFEAAILDIERLTDVDPRLLRDIRHSFRCVWMGAPFAVFHRGVNGAPGIAGDRLRALLDRMAALESPEERGFTPHRPGPGRAPAGSKVAICVTTYERPTALSRSLPGIVRLGAPVLVIDDGSRPEAALLNRKICEREGVLHLLLPENRGLPAAMNMALDFWLADPLVEWISYLQDDVDVRPELLEVMGSLQDAEKAPLLTGFDAADHPTVSTSDSGGRTIKMKRTSPAVHLHGHRSYWASVMPIPSPYLGAPKQRIGASLEDWWITCHAPLSVEKRGLLLPCAPGLVTTFLSHRDDSTWDNPSTG